MSEWPRVRLGECCEIVGGATPSTTVGAYWDGDICWATPKDLSGLEGAFVSDTARKLTREGLNSCAADVLPVGSVLFSSRAPIGHVALNTVPMATNQGFKSFVPRPDRVHAKFLYHWLRRNRPYFESLGNGATFKEVSKAVVSRIEISLPPLSEQRRIAEVLDRAETLRAKRRAALAQLDTVTQPIFLDMFGDPATNPKGWPCVEFGELGENQDSQRVPVKSSDRDARAGKYPYYGASGIIDWVDEFIFEGDRLLIGEDGANLVARTTPVAYIARGKYWVNNHAHVIAGNGQAELRFLEFFIEHLDLKPFISGTAQPKLNRSNLDRIPVPLPPAALQRDFARRITTIEQLKTSYLTSLAEMDTLFASIQHRAFRGEL